MESQSGLFRDYIEGDKSRELETLELLAMKLAPSTELGAIAAALTAGFGDKHLSDEFAVKAMRNYLNAQSINGTIVIGEGERDDAPMLFIGEKVGKGIGDKIDIAVDPLENTNATAVFGPRASSVLAASEQGGLIAAPDMYMNKLIVGPEAKDKVDIDAPVKDNLRKIAKALDRDITDLVIVVLDRPRHARLIADIRSANARVQLIPDGDLIPGIAACMRGSGIHAVMGIGAAPEGVLCAAGLKCLNGGIQARFWPKDEEEKSRLIDMGGDPNKVYLEKDLACGKRIIFSATGVTDGELMRGVKFFGGGARTHSLVMTSLNGGEGKVSFIDRVHVVNKEKIEFKL